MTTTLPSVQEIIGNRTVSELTSLHMAYIDQVYTVERAKKRLHGSIRSLERTLAQERAYLEEEVDRTPNSLGICQSQAHDVDRECALYAKEKETLAMLQNLVKRADEGK